jgi:hypothetical protein
MVTRRRKRQDWIVGEVMQVGFMRLIYAGVFDGYKTLRTEDCTAWYQFEPYKGLYKI